MDEKRITNFFFELNQLKRERNTGFQLAGVNDPDSVAEHAMRAAQMAYVLAVLEKDADPEKAAIIALFHNNGKTRIGDQNKVAAKYLFKQEAEEFTFVDQIEGMSSDVEKRLLEYHREWQERQSREGVIARDADWLEQAFQAKEYFDLGYRSTKKIMDNVGEALETTSAKKIYAQMKKKNFTDWWDGLMQMTYQKLKNK
jgi:putative hydrolase of HD superfamily